MRYLWKFALVVAVAFIGFGAAPGSGETYTSATIDSSGQLLIRTTTGKAIRRKATSSRDAFGKQVGFDDVAISPDRKTVAWLALYPNCCTSYPVPLQLVTYSNGRTRRFTGNGLAVSRWRFVADGKRVAFKQETVHGSLNTHYELRDVATGKLVEKYDPPSSRDPNVERTPELQDAPAWVAELDPVSSKR